MTQNGSAAAARMGAPAPASIPPLAERAATVALFNAIDRAGCRSSLPHPVHARNQGLVQTWQQWPAAQIPVLGRRGVDRLRDPAVRYAENDELLAHLMERDPMYGGAPGPEIVYGIAFAAQFAAAALTYWQRPHVLIELTPALDRLLASSDVGDDVPAGQLHPPAPSCYIAFGPAMRADLTLCLPEGYPPHCLVGAYVFESPFLGCRAISIVGIYDVDNERKQGITCIDILIRNEQDALNAVIDRQCAHLVLSPSVLPQQKALAVLCTKVFLYWSMEHAQRRTETPFSGALTRLSAVGPKKAARLRRHVEQLYDRVLVGPATLPEHLRAAHGDVAPHWRRGHFRMQAYGPKMGLRKVIFIAPTLVRAGAQRA